MAPSRVSKQVVPYLDKWSDMVARNRKRAAAGEWVLPAHAAESRALPAGTVLMPSSPVPAAPALSPAAASSLGVSFAGINRWDAEVEFGGSAIPPDTMGAIGPAHFMELINGAVAIYDRANGQELSFFSADAFFASTFFGIDYPRANMADPRVLFDRRSGRWLACALDGGEFNHAILAVSETDDPTGNWCKYLVEFGMTDTATDFDTLGTDDNGVYLAARVFQLAAGTPSETDASSVSIAALEKAPLLAGTPGNVSFFDGVDDMFATPQPAHNLDPVPPGGPAWFVSSWPYTRNNGSQSANVVYRTLIWAGDPGERSPTLRAGTVLTTPAFGNPLRAPARGSRVRVHASDKRLQMAVIRQQRLWTCRTIGVNAVGTETGADRDSCEWLQLSLSGSAATLGQSGRVFDGSASDPRFYYFPSINVGAGASNWATQVAQLFTSKPPSISFG